MGKKLTPKEEQELANIWNNRKTKITGKDIKQAKEILDGDSTEIPKELKKIKKQNKKLNDLFD